MMDRKKELKEIYKNMRTDMGVFGVRSNFSNKILIEETPNLKGRMNRAKFQLSAGSFPNKDLQADWKQGGEAGFTIEVLETLEYDKDESKTDYSEELALLKMIWEEKLLKQGLELYG